MGGHGLRIPGGGSGLRLGVEDGTLERKEGEKIRILIYLIA